jgi:carbamoyl-phosphate synthase large subunit
MDNPSPGLAVVRSLREAPSRVRRVVGLTFNAANTGAYAGDLLDEVHIVPAPSEPAEILFARIKEILGRSRIDVVVPTLDTEIAAYARLRIPLAQMGVRVLVPPEERVKERAKIALPMLCAQLQIPHPETFVLTDKRQLDHYLGKTGFPCVLKGAVADAHVVLSRDEAEVFFTRLANTWGFPVLLQRFLDGDEYDVAALANRQSELVGAVAMRKTAITPKGKAAGGVTVWDEKLLAMVERLVRRLQWVGPLEVEFIKERRTGAYHVFEINARFPAWIYLTTGAGQNFPLAAARLAMDEAVAKFSPYRAGVLFVRNMQEHLCTISQFGQLATVGEVRLHG